MQIMAVETQFQIKTFFKPNLPPKGIMWGYSLVYEYFYSQPYTLVVKASRIAAYHGLRDNHYALTVIGWALNDMVRRGFLEKIGKKAYMVTEKFERIVFEHGFQCMSEIGPCGYYGSNMCPFRRGVVWVRK